MRSSVGPPRLLDLTVRLLFAVTFALTATLGAWTPADAALASEPPRLSPAEIWKTGFEGAYPPPGMTIRPTDGEPTATAWWGRIEQSRRGSSGYGLWCAGNTLGNWATYPKGTRGQAVLSLPALSEYYSSQLGFWYTMPSRGAADTFSFIVGWYGTDGQGGWQSYANYGLTTSWQGVTYDLSRDSGNYQNLSRRGGTVFFEFDDRDEGGGQYQGPTTGQGPTIDDLTVTGYKYGPVRNLAEVSPSPGTVDLTWTKPARATGTTADDERTLTYRVWRRALGGSTWTERTSARLATPAFTDTAVPGGLTYTYLVQAWDTGTGAGYGLHQTTGNVSVTGTADTTAPTIPTDVVASATSSTAVKASWSPSSDGSGSGIKHYLVYLNGVLRATVTDTSASISSLTPSTTYSVTVRAVDIANNTSAASGAVSVTTPAPPGPASVTRVSDATRFSSALAIARAGYPGWAGVKHVVIASGDDRAAADPLSASGLCWAYDAPMLLVSAASTPAEVKTAIKQITDANGQITLHVVGGPVSVPNDRVAELVAAGGGSAKVTTDRILSTGGRYEMAAAIASRMKAVRGAEMPPVALIANGADSTKFFDALALSPIARAKGAPVLLVGHDTIPAATASALNTLKPTTTIVGGGPKTVSDRVVSTLRATRWSGATRFETAIAIADGAVSRGWVTRQDVGIAARLPDALTGGSLAGAKGGVLLLSDGASLTPATASWLKANKTHVRAVHVFGGPKSITEGVIAQIRNVLK